MPPKKICLLILFFTFYVVGFGQDSIISFKTRRDSIDAVIAAMRKRNVVESGQIGIVGLPSRQYNRFLYLQKFCTARELVSLTSDSNKCIKLYAYLALVYRKYNDISVLKKELLADSGTVTMIETCIYGPMLVKQMPERMLNWYGQSELSFFDQAMSTPNYRDKFFAALLSEKENESLLQ